MKRNMIIATAIAAAGVASYFIRRRFSTGSAQLSEPQNGRSNHITNAFSRAKKHAVNA